MFDVEHIATALWILMGAYAVVKQPQSTRYTTVKSQKNLHMFMFLALVQYLNLNVTSTCFLHVVSSAYCVDTL